MQADYPEIILASASSARADILASAGVRFHQRPSNFDEYAEHDLLSGRVPPQDAALHLARKKAQNVLAQEANAIVIGADQVLDLGGEIIKKPPTLDEARNQLKRLRGQSHTLHSASVIVTAHSEHDYVDSAVLTMRDFSDEFLEWYLESANESVLTSVGAYHFEGLGIHLFSKVEGDYFTILGLPIVPILDQLRELKVLIA